MAEGQTRRALFRWLGWFAMANAVILALIGLGYFSGYMPGRSALAWVYLVTVYAGHHVMIAVGPLFLLATPVVLLAPRRRLVMALAVFIFAIMIALIMLDSLLWQQSRFHINILTMKILGWQSWLFVAVIFLIGLVFESMLAGWCWRWVMARSPRHGRLVALVAVVSIIISQSIHAWADATYFVPVTSVGQQLPVYEGITAKKQLTRWGLVDPEQSREQVVARRLSRQLDSAADRLLNRAMDIR